MKKSAEIIGTLTIALLLFIVSISVKGGSMDKAEFNREPMKIGSSIHRELMPYGYKIETATFAAGCFWGVEAAFRELNGVIGTTVGYTGGFSKEPTYKQVCTGASGHAEAVKVMYDRNVISYDELVDYFWRIHNPTTLNRQGPDFGSQYRSAIFYYNEEQKKAAELSKEKFEQSGVLNDNVVTEIVSVKTFYNAEEYHQDYYSKKGVVGCHYVRDK